MADDVVHPVDATGVERTGKLGVAVGNEATNLLNDVLVATVEEVGRAELASQSFLFRFGVDGDDARSPLDTQSLNSVEPNAAAAVHDRGLADLDVGAIQHRTSTRHHATANEAGRCERNVLGNLHGLETTNHCALGKHRSSSKVPARFTIQRERLSHVSECLTTTRGLALRAGLADAARSKR